MITQKRTQSLFFNKLVFKIKLQEEDESVDGLISEIFGEDNNNNNNTGDVENYNFGSFPEDDSNIWTEYLFSVITSKTLFLQTPSPYSFLYSPCICSFILFFLIFFTLIEWIQKMKNDILGRQTFYCGGKGNTTAHQKVNLRAVLWAYIDEHTRRRKDCSWF